MPSLNAAVQEGANIVVHRAKDLQVMVDGQPKTITTTRDNLAEALVEAKTNEPTVSVQAVRNTTGLDFALPLLSSGGTVRVMHDNTTSFGSLVGEANLVQALEAAGVTLGGTDKLTITPASKRGLDIKIVRVTEEDVVLASAIAFNTVEQKDDSLYKGQKRTVQKGVAGEKQSTFHVVREDGQEVSSVVTAETVTRQPQDAIVKVGTQEPPAAPAAPAGAPAGGAGAPAGGVWVALAQCESGGRVNAVSSGGHYHGLYQFSPSTWRSVGGQGLPSQASAEEQTMRAQMLQARSGWGQWPACSRKLGLM